MQARLKSGLQPLETFLVIATKVRASVADWLTSKLNILEYFFCLLSIVIDISKKKAVQKQSKVKTPKVKVTVINHVTQ